MVYIVILVAVVAVGVLYILDRVAINDMEKRIQADIADNYKKLVNEKALVESKIIAETEAAVKVCSRCSGSVARFFHDAVGKVICANCDSAAYHESKKA